MEIAGVTTMTKAYNAAYRASHQEQLRAMRKARYALIKPAQLARQKKWAAANPGVWKNADLKRKYGITLEQYGDRLRSQGGVCASCGNPPRGTGRAGFHVDHCHSTGVVRGILCSGCNTALGLLLDDPTRIAALGRYITQFTRRI